MGNVIWSKSKRFLRADLRHEGAIQSVITIKRELMLAHLIVALMAGSCLGMFATHRTEGFFMKSSNKRPRAHNNEQRMGCTQSACKPNPPNTSPINQGLAP